MLLNLWTLFNLRTLLNLWMFFNLWMLLRSFLMFLNLWMVFDIVWGNIFFGWRPLAILESFEILSPNVLC